MAVRKATLSVASSLNVLGVRGSKGTSATAWMKSCHDRCAVRFVGHLLPPGAKQRGEPCVEGLRRAAS